MNFRSFAPVILGSILVALPTVAAGNGIWAAWRAGEDVIVYGRGAADRSYEPSAIKSVNVIDAAGKTIPSVVESGKKRTTVVTGDSAAVFFVEADMGLFSKDAEGYWRKGARTDVPGSTTTTHQLKYAISVAHLHGDLPALQPQKFQIIPLTNPSEVPLGTKLKVRVLFEGQPLAGAEITPDLLNFPSRMSGKTDAQGEAEIVVQNEGITVMSVVHVAP